MRLSVDKLLKSKIVDYANEAVIRVFKENILPFFEKYDSNHFRNEKLWCEACDIAIKAE